MTSQPRTLHHNLISLPKEKTADDIVAERHDIVLLFDATKSNPNGDPDTGNMPRLQPDTLRGLVTDVCLKRKVRNFFSLYNPKGNLVANESVDRYQIFVRENAVFQNSMELDDEAQMPTRAKAIFDASTDPKKGKWEKPAKGKASKNEYVTRSYRDALCQAFFDVRAFGGVTSTDGPMKGTFYGQIRGPLQFSFAESLDRILQLDATITRCAVASEKEKKETASAESEETGNRTMGRKYVIDYGLYRTHIYFSPAFAAKTGFTYYDLDNFFFALKHMFRDDVAAGRTCLRVVGLVDFQHSSSLGNEHAHKLFEKVRVKRTDESRKRGDYPKCPDNSDSIDPLHHNYVGEAPEDGPLLEIENEGKEEARVTVKRLVWEIKPCPKTTTSPSAP